MSTQFKRMSESSDHDYFVIEGIVDAGSEAFLKELPKKVRAAKVRFDFSGAGRINSMGIALLLRCFKEIGDGAQITLEGLSPMHSMLFKMTGVFLLATPVEGADRKEGAA